MVAIFFLLTDPSATETWLIEARQSVCPLSGWLHFGGTLLEFVLEGKRIFFLNLGKGQNKWRLAVSAGPRNMGDPQF